MLKNKLTTSVPYFCMLFIKPESIKRVYNLLSPIIHEQKRSRKRSA